MYFFDIIFIRNLNENVSYYLSLEIKMLRKEIYILDCFYIRSKICVDFFVNGYYLEFGV